MGIKSSETVWFHAVIISGQALGMPIGGYLYAKIGFRPVTIVGMLMCSGGVLLSRLTVDYGLGPFIFTYAVMFGVGMGLPYAVLFTVAAKWFPNNRSLVTGIILGGLGMGAILFTPLQQALINPNNLPFNDPRVAANVPTSFLILGGIMVGLQIVGFTLLREPKASSLPEDELSYVDNSTSEEKPADLDKSQYSMEDQEIKQEPVEQYSYTMGEAVKTADFWIISLIIFLNSIPITLQASTYKVYGKEKGLNDTYLSAVATCTALFNAGGRVIWGIVCDHASYKFPLAWVLVEWTLLLSTFPFIGESGVLDALYPIWVFGLFFTMAGHFVLMPGACHRIFGPKNIAAIYGVIYAFTAPGALMLAGIVSQYSINGQYIPVYLSCAGVTFTSFILSLFLRDNHGLLSSVTNVCVRMCDCARHEPEHKEFHHDEMQSILTSDVVSVRL